MGTLQLAVAILGVVMLNAAIGFAQEYSAQRTAQALEAMVPHACRVLRGGRRLEVPARGHRHGRPAAAQQGRRRRHRNGHHTAVQDGRPWARWDCPRGRSSPRSCATDNRPCRIRRCGSGPVTRSFSSRTTRPSRRSTPRSSERSPLGAPSRPAPPDTVLVLGLLQGEVGPVESLLQAGNPVAPQGTDPVPGADDLRAQQFGGSMSGGVLAASAQGTAVGRFGVHEGGVRGSGGGE